MTPVRCCGIAYMAASLLILGIGGCGSSTGNGPSLSEQYQTALLEPDPVLRSRRLAALAEQQQKAGDVLGAESSLAAARTAAVASTDPASRASALANLAGAAARLARGATEVAAILRTAAESIEEIDDPGSKVRALADLAAATGEHLKSADAAAAYLAKAEEAAEVIATPQPQIAARMRIARAYAGLDREEAAEQTIGQALVFARERTDSREKSECLADIAAALSAMNQNEEAEKVFDEAGKAVETINADDARAYAMLTLAERNRAAGRNAKSEELLSKAHDLAMRVTDSSVRTPLLEEIDELRRPH